MPPLPVGEGWGEGEINKITRDTMKIFRFFSVIFLLIVIVLGLTFAAMNATPVSIRYYVGTATVNLSLLLVYSLGIGIILGFLTTFSLKSVYFC